MEDRDLTKASWEDQVIVGTTENGHDASVAIVKNGRLVAALASERDSGVKKDANVKDSVLEYVCLQANVKVEDIDWVVSCTCGHDPTYHQMDRNKDGGWRIKSKPGIVKGLSALSNEDPDEGKSGLKVTPKTYYIPHHICHAASAYFTSPFNEAVCATLDCCDFDYYVGRGLNSLYSHFRGNKFIHNVNPYCYDGVKYAQTTDYTGFDPCLERAGTLMGLASYGKYKERWADLINAQPEVRGGHVEKPRYPKYTEDLESVMDIAKTQQVIFEENVMKFVDGAAETLGVPDVNNVCLSGGSFLNCNLNGRIVRERDYNTHLFPACGDDGLSVGAALFFNHCVLGAPRVEYSEKELVYLGFEYSKHADIDHAYIAKKIADGKVVGLMNGRAEFGPRALGNRSILADPRNPHMKEWINHMIKKREWFRPFAPMVLEEEYEDWFDFPIPSPYMLYTAPVKQPDKIPAVTHVDNTARFQTVREETNPDAYKILQEFKKITGIPVLLNTSLNGKGQPIFEYEKHAYKFWDEIPIDMMVIHGTVLER